MNGIHVLRKPYLLMIGDVDNAVSAKTAFGLKDWVPEACLGQLRFKERAVDLGLPDQRLREIPEIARSAERLGRQVHISPRCMQWF